jgi:hypothetical protein
MLYPCDESRCLGASCRVNMTGLLCAECVNPTDIKYSGLCVPMCPGGGTKYWALLFSRYLGLALVCTLLWRACLSLGLA